MGGNNYKVLTDIFWYVVHGFGCSFHRDDAVLVFNTLPHNGIVSPFSLASLGALSDPRQVLLTPLVHLHSVDASPCVHSQNDLYPVKNNN